MSKSFGTNPIETKIVRLSDSFTGASEKLVLNYLAHRIPAAIVPDHLTAIGLAGAVLAALGLVASHASVHFLWLSLLGLVLNWFGDSLDGTLARVRSIERPRYGFFLDFLTDLVAQICIIVGLGLSPFMRLDVALLALVGYLSLSIYALVKLHVTRAMQLSFMGVGPTEIRLVLGAGFMWAALLAVPHVTSPLGHFSMFDVIGMTVFAFAMISGLTMFGHDLKQLAKMEPPRHAEPREVIMVDLTARAGSSKHAVGTVVD